MKMAQAAGGSIKIDNTEGSFMPAHVEILGEGSTFIHFSVSHYYEQNGDLVPDPDMEFLVNVQGLEKEMFWVTPVHFQQGNLYMPSISKADMDLNRFTSLKYYPRAMSANKSFATMWVKNIFSQQGLNTRKAI